MKFKALLFALVLCGMGACTQRTCPTYTKQDVEKQQIVDNAAQAERV